MGILEQIANPKVPSYLESLKVVSDIKDREAMRREQEVKSGIALQNMQAQQQQAEQQQRGYEMIGQTLTQQQPTAGPTATGPQQSPVAQAMTQVPIDYVEQAKTLTDLTNKIVSMPNMPKSTVDALLQLRKNAEEHAATQTKEQRDQLNEFQGVVGNLLHDAAKDEENKDFAAAKTKYDEVMNYISKEPNFQKNPDIQKFLEAHKEYRPNQAKIMYVATELGSHARTQYQEELKTIESARHNLATESQAYRNASETQRHNIQTELQSQENALIQQSKTNKEADFKAADAKAIYSMAVGYNGGLFDAEGNPKFLDPNKTKDVQDLSNLAAIMFSRGKAKTHNEAISMAAKQLDMKMVTPDIAPPMETPKKPTVKPSMDISQIPKTHIDYLKAHPETRKDFDKNYPGMSKVILGD